MPCTARIRITNPKTPTRKVAVLTICGGNSLELSEGRRTICTSMSPRNSTKMFLYQEKFTIFRVLTLAHLLETLSRSRSALFVSGCDVMVMCMMFMCVVCTYTHTYTYTQTHTCTKTKTHMHVQKHIQKHTHIHVHNVNRTPSHVTFSHVRPHS